MSGIIAASRVEEQTLVLEAEAAPRFYINLKTLGSLSGNLGNGDYFNIYSTDDLPYSWKSYDYTQPYTGNILLRGNLNLIKYFQAETLTGVGVIKVAFSEIAKMTNLQYLSNGNLTSYMYGDFLELPHKLQGYYVLNGLISGTLADLPRTITSFQNIAENSITGNIIDLPPNIKIFAIQRNSDIYGNISDLPQTIETLQLYNNYNLKIKGTVKDLSPSMKYFSYDVSGDGYLNGNLSDLKNGIISFYLSGNSVINGSISDLPASLLFITIYSINETTFLIGNLLDLNRNMLEFALDAPNIINGNIADIPNSLYYFIVNGDNTLFGNISELSLNITSFQVLGNNTITGDIADIKAPLNNFQLYGYNTIYGDVANLRSSLQRLDIKGNNDLTGDVATIPSSILEVDIRGNNTLYGNLGTIQKQVVRIVGASTCTYTGTTWRSPMYDFIYMPATTGLTPSEVDQLLIDLSVPEWGAYYRIDLRGANASRTTNSNIAVALLQSKGVTVLTN